MFRNYERCPHCNRLKWLTTGCLRKLLKLECKHYRAIENKDCSSSCLPERKSSFSLCNKLWKYKVAFTGGKKTLQRPFGKSRSSTIMPSYRHSEHEGKKELECRTRKQAKCDHSDGHFFLRGHHHHATLEGCSIYCQLSKHGWYWGDITSSEAEELLAGQHDNVFLVRDSYDSKHILCVSFRCVGRTLHTRLLHSNGLFSLNNETFVPANRISEHCSAVNVKTDLFDMPVKLARPLNRFARLDSLQMICRFVIRQTFSSKVWNKLPLPQKLMTYVSCGSDYIVPS